METQRRRRYLMGYVHNSSPCSGMPVAVLQLDTGAPLLTVPAASKLERGDIVEVRQGQAHLVYDN
jgi:hypothetical protein